MLRKVGPHVIETTPAAMRWAAVAPIVKQLDGTQALQAAPDGALRIYRYYFGDQELYFPPDHIAGLILAGLNGYRHRKLYAEVFNEAFQILGQGLEEYVALQAKVVAILHANGVKVAGFSFSTGNPTVEAWAYCRAHGFSGCDLVSLHEYWGAQGFTVDNALRHRQLWKPGDPLIVITEGTEDEIEGGTAGWKRAGQTAEQFIGKIKAYAGEIDQDSSVEGWTPFSSGCTPDWWAFSLDDISDQLIQEDTTVAYSVGPGIAAKMQQQNDAPKSDEQYVGSEMSFAFGEKGVYIYSKQANETYFLARTA